jgi:hypothetical protein
VLMTHNLYVEMDFVNDSLNYKMISTNDWILITGGVHGPEALFK